jgi:hypothetical protein
MSEYYYLLLTVFNRPFEEAYSVEPPIKGFMSLKIWKHMTEEQFGYLYAILNTNTLSKDQKYTIFNNSIYIYNAVLKETTRVQSLIKNKEKIKLRQKKYREANRDKLREIKKKYREANKDKISLRKKKYREANKDKIILRKKKYREANKDKIKARNKARYWRNKNGRND